MKELGLSTNFMQHKIDQIAEQEIILTWQPTDNSLDGLPQSLNKVNSFTLFLDVSLGSVISTTAADFCDFEVACKARILLFCSLEIGRRANNGAFTW